jgi:hypothetical protein
MSCLSEHVSGVGATRTAVTANVTGTFSEAMNASNGHPATFTLTAGTTPLPAAVAYNSRNRVATLNPTADVMAGTTYTATIKGGTNGAKDNAFSDGRLAHHPFSKGAWGARTFVGRGWSTYNIFRWRQSGRDTNRPRRKTSWSCKPPHVFR